MLVSAVSASSLKTVFNTGIKKQIKDNSNDNAFVYFNDSPGNITVENQMKIFESINEWKNFCHNQIEQGKFDIIA